MQGKALSEIKRLAENLEQDAIDLYDDEGDWEECLPDLKELDDDAYRIIRLINNHFPDILKIHNYQDVEPAPVLAVWKIEFGKKINEPSEVFQANCVIIEKWARAITKEVETQMALLDSRTEQEESVKEQVPEQLKIRKVKKYVETGFSKAKEPDVQKPKEKKVDRIKSEGSIRSFKINLRVIEFSANERELVILIIGLVVGFVIGLGLGSIL